MEEAQIIQARDTSPRATRILPLLRPSCFQGPKWCTILHVPVWPILSGEIVCLVQSQGDYHNIQSASPRSSNLPLLLHNRLIILILLKWVLYHIQHLIVRILQNFMSPILNLFLYITLILLFLIWTSIQFPIKFLSIIGIGETNWLIPTIDVELMGGLGCTR